jgi:NAD(P)-dependent dehydrogenase (short-subunit alcohol dehydrogenase family)
MATVRELFETNTFGTMAVTQAVLPQFRQRKAGVVVNVTSSVTLKSIPLIASYTASKAAVNAFTESMALELKPFGVRARLVLPGRSPETRFGDNAHSHTQGLDHEAYADLVKSLFARFAEPGPITHAQDVAEAVWRGDRPVVPDAHPGWRRCRGVGGRGPLAGHRSKSLTRHDQRAKEMTMQDKPVALVTGANQGIGLQIAKDLAAKNFTILVGSRNLERGEAAAEEVGPDAHALQLDVTDPASIAAAAERVRKEFGRLDVLINNAAISNTRMRPDMSVEVYSKSTRPSVVSLDEVRAVFETNVFGVLAVTQAMLTLLREAPAGRIVNVSSGVGSLTRNSDPAYPYRSIFGPVYPASKTALNAMTLAMAIELESTNIKVNAACPGFTKTNLNNYAGTQSVEEGAREPVRLALLGPDGPTGTFSNATLGTLPW